MTADASPSGEGRGDSAMSRPKPFVKKKAPADKLRGLFKTRHEPYYVNFFQKIVTVPLARMVSAPAHPSAMLRWSV